MGQIFFFFFLLTDMDTDEIVVGLEDLSQAATLVYWNARGCEEQRWKAISQLFNQVNRFIGGCCKLGFHEMTEFKNLTGETRVTFRFWKHLALPFAITA